MGFLPVCDGVVGRGSATTVLVTRSPGVGWYEGVLGRVGTSYEVEKWVCKL